MAISKNMKAFLDMLAYSEEQITSDRRPIIMVTM